MDISQTITMQRKAETFLNEFPEDHRATILHRCDGRPSMMGKELILEIAHYTRVEPWELIRDHGLGAGRLWRIDELTQLTRDFNGAELCTMHTATA